jgi:hopene-associated glycosyltransferase HpnB
VPSLLHAVAVLPLLIWLYLLVARGGFWREPNRLDSPLESTSVPASPPGPPCSIVAVIPARDEAHVIGGAVESLLRQRFAGAIHVVVIDDASSDGTAEAALAAARAAGASARLTVIPSAPLARGWTGKLWALSQGISLAAQRQPEYLLLTDADIHHDADNVAALVAHARAQGCDLASFMVRLCVASFAEKCLIPAFVFFFLKLYPPAWICSSRHRTAGAAGGCVLVRPVALERIGGLQAIRSEIIDDCALASAIKRTGGTIWLGLTRTAHSIRSYGTFGEVGRLISRTAFSQLRHSYALLLATLTGLALTYLAPPLLLTTGDRLAIALGAGAWILMSIAYLPMVRFYGLSALWSLSLPAVALFYGGATAQSAVQYALGRGGHWKGRAQDLRA